MLPGVWPELDGIAGGPLLPLPIPASPAALVRPGCPAAHPAAAPPASVDLAEVLLAANGSSASPASPRPVRPSGRSRSGPPVSILQGCCLLRTAAHQPQRLPGLPGWACCPPGPPPGPPASILQGCCLPRTAAHQPQRHPTPPGKTQGKYPDNNRGRCPDSGHHAQKPGTPPIIRTPTHHPGNTATVRDARPGENAADARHAASQTQTAPPQLTPQSRTGQDLRSGGSPGGR